MIKPSTIGSIWRKCDLHFHTPCSYDYDDKSLSDERILAALRDAGVEIVAVTDHHTINVARIRRLQNLGGDVVTVFPGIELRSELGGRDSVHFIGIFPDDADLERIWTTLQGKLSLTPSDIAAKGGDDCIYSDFREAAEVIRYLDGLVTVHAGRKKNSIEEVSNTKRFKQAMKTDLLRECVDFLEIGRTADAASYRDIVFPTVGKTLPIIICSDNHDAKAYRVAAPCWLKCDPTFAGLRQVLNEPDDRVFRGDTPPSVERTRTNPTRYVASLRLGRKPKSTITEAWFDQTIELNSSLVAIIGNKGSGKSALADSLGLLGNSPLGQAFAFLNSDQFRNPKANKAEHFEATIRWVSDHDATRGLDLDPDEAAPELIKYIPQKYLETICNELREPSASAFDRELKAVIFSHVAEAERLDCSTLDELLEYKTEEIQAAIAIMTEELAAQNKRIIALQDMASEGYRRRLEKQRDAKRAELEAHNATKPVEMPKPETDPTSQAEIAAVLGKVQERREQLAVVGEKIAVASDEQKTSLRRKANAEKLLAKLANVESQLSRFQTDVATELSELSLNIEDILIVTIRREPVQQVVADEQAKTAKLAEALNPQIEGSLTHEKNRIEREIAELESKLDEPSSRHQANVKSLEEWSRKRDEIVGTAKALGTVSHLENEIEALAGVPDELRRMENERRQVTRRMHGKLEELVRIYRLLYKPVQDFISTHPLATDQFALSFDAAIVDAGLEEQFLSFINQQRKGSFCGLDEGRSVVRSLLRSTDFRSSEGALKFLDAIVERLQSDYRGEDKTPAVVADQLRKGVTLEQLYDFLFGLRFLRPRYALRWAGKDVDQCTPGERGTLLLIFYLLIDNGEIPLVIDQPDDNLDNQTIVSTLVPCIKEVKKRRQVFIVTHNPNLAVVCDAEQVIAASFDKTSSSIRYASGAIENPDMNKRIVDILEGTRPAFDNRDKKYKVVLPLSRQE